MDDQYKKVKGVLSKAGFKVSELSTGELKGLAAKTPEALADWIQDMRPRKKRKQDPAVMPPLLSESYVLAKKFNIPMVIDNIIIDGSDSLTDDAITLLMHLIQQANLKPETRPVETRGYWVPVRSGAIVKISRGFLKSLMGARTIEEVDDALKLLYNEDIHLSVVEKGSGKQHHKELYHGQARWIVSKGRIKDTDEVVIQFNPGFFDLLKYLNKERPMGYTKDLLPPSAFNFKRKISYRLYRLAHRWRNIKKSRSWEVAQFKSMFNCQDEGTPYFNKRTLEPAVIEINKKLSSLMLVSVVKEKMGKQIYAYHLKVDQRKRIVAAKTDIHDDLYAQPQTNDYEEMYPEYCGQE